MARSYRYKKRSSARSGFDYKDRELVKDGAYWVHPDEIDQPPPSKQSLGGEGDISGDPRANSDFWTSGTANILEVYPNPIVYVVGTNGLTPDFTHPYMRVEGSNGNITLVSNPRIAAGREGQVLTLFCTGTNRFAIPHGSGVNLMASANMVLFSGGIATFIYNTANNAWNETSRITEGGFGG